ncbi:SGNH/GDSL hydrolase family protein [Gordonia sp. i37]|uniref:SGNH/GDSL hydrolase family protein n=1 Tax=Gordonia sp. i37 TaxID=1961707 RepID=UPI0009AC15EA|nr:SGNH/GDSL hydrolase family protein [Gordonia sp. i37]OPX16840.1 esterase [Gordonia sp. i37]
MSRALFGRVATAVAALVAAAVVVLPGSASVPSAAESTTVQTAAQRQPETSLSSAAAPQKYVALGSSYAAGPGGLDSIGNRCLRTMDNYPHQVAQAMNMSLVDATCSGATTENILDRPQRFVKQPQIDAVTPGTALVTITTGGNDIGYVQRLIAMGCKNSVADPVKKIAERVCGHGRPISPEPGFERYAAVEQKMIETVFAVRMRAPAARIVLVDYPPVVVAGGPICPKLALTPEEIESTIRVYDALAQVTAEAAQISGAELVTTGPLGAEHTVCSPDPWLRGFELPVPYHPNASGKAGVARLIVDALRR